LTASLIAFCVCELAMAQAGSVQLPQVERFSAVATAGVPDRGNVFLGGVSRAAESRSWFGPFPMGHAVGWERSYSGLSTQIYIHDLRAMDAALLASPIASNEKLADTELKGMARWAWQQLQQRGHFPDSARRARSGVASGRAGKGRTRPTGTPEVDLARGARFFELGSAAEARGNFRLARLYYRMAQKHGSAAAARRLETLNSGKTAQANRQIRASNRSVQKRLR